MTAVLPLAPTGAARPLPLRWRADLEVRRQRLGGIAGWSVKDPLTLKHFHLRDEEFALVGDLDGRRSIEDVRRDFERRFPPLRLDVEKFQVLIARLHADGLLVSDSPGQAAVLLERDRAARRTNWIRKLSSVLSYRLPGFDPDPLLRRLQPWVGGFFGPVGVTCSALLMLAAIGLLAGRATEVRQRLPAWQEMVEPARLPLLLVVLSATKILHELSHGLVCRRFGSECREMGVLFLMFTPCLYCDVSDAWRIPDRRRRAAVAAAGIWSDLTVASAAVFVWWFTRPGLLNSVALDAMTVCGLGTLVFNGNPLLRYDGYFILSDLLDMPNLWQESRAVLMAAVRRIVLGLRTGPLPLLSSGRPLQLAAYGLASQSYLLAVTFGAMGMVWDWADRWQVEWLAMAAGASVFVGLAAPPAGWLFSMLANPSVRRRIRLPRALAGAAAAGGLGFLALAVPLPSRVAAPVVLEPAGADALYVRAPGQIVEQRRPGDELQPGDVVLRLDNPALQRELVRLEGEAEWLEARLRQIEGRLTIDEDAYKLLPGVRESLAEVRDRRERRRIELEKLSIKAVRAGVLFPPQTKPPEPTGTGRLPSWSGSPLDPRNQGAMLDTGALVGWVGDRDRFEALALLDEEDVERVSPGQRVRLQLAVWPGRTFTGQVREVARRDAESAPQELIRTGRIAARRDSSRPRDTYFQARITLDPTELPLVNRAQGESRIDVAPRSIGRTLLDAWRRTFRFEE